MISKLPDTRVRGSVVIGLQNLKRMLGAIKQGSLTLKGASIREGHHKIGKQ